MTFQIKRRAAEGINARVKPGERANRSEYIAAVMHHAVRMTGGLRFK